MQPSVREPDTAQNTSPADEALDLPMHTSRDLPLVSVIVPVYNDAAGLAATMASLSVQTYPAERLEILVVDNGSDRSFDEILRANPVAKLLRESQLGSYAARNCAVRSAAGQILAFTDADCRPVVDWITNAVARLNTTRGVALGGRIKFSFLEPDRPNLYELYDVFTYLDQEKYLRDQSFAATANLFVPREVFTRVGLFDSSLKSGGDREWGGRAARKGIATVFAENVVVEHPARSTFRSLAQKTRRIEGGLIDLQRRGVVPAPKTLGQRFGRILPLPPLRRMRSAEQLARERNPSHR